MKTFLIENEKFIKDKPEFLLKFNIKGLNISFFIDNNCICNFEFLNPIEKFYKNKTLLKFETNYDYAVKKLKEFSKSYFYKNNKYYISFNRDIDFSNVSFTNKIELTTENFDINIYDDKVQFYLLVDKSNF